MNSEIINSVNYSVISYALRFICAGLMLVTAKNLHTY